jgi:hypothetical protein
VPSWYTTSVCQLQAMSPTVLVEEDLEEGDEEDADVDEIADQLAGSHLE